MSKNVDPKPCCECNGTGICSARSKPEAKSDHQHKFVKADVGMQSNLGTPVRYECSCGKARIELEEDQPTKSDIRNRLEACRPHDGSCDRMPHDQVEALVAQERREARIDEWHNLLGNNIDKLPDDLISVPTFWIKERLAELEATDKGAE